MTNIRWLLGSLVLALVVSGCSAGKKDETAQEAEPPVSEHSSAGLPAGDIAAGEKLASTVRATGQACVGCHGKEGAAPIDASYPKLAGQYHDYIASALQMYRDGRRQNTLMAAQAKELTDQQIADLAAYFDSREHRVYDLAEHQK